MVSGLDGFDLNLCTQRHLRDGVPDVGLRTNHCGHARRVGVVDQHRGIEIPVRERRDGVVQVHPNLLHAHLILSVVCRHDDHAPSFSKWK